jgi:hypothetical protein
VKNDEVEMGENGSSQKSNFLKVKLHVSLTVETFLVIKNYFILMIES